MGALKQLGFNLCLNDDASFGNFFVNGNSQLLDILQALHKDKNNGFVCFWGASGSGKTHLLSALCQLFNDHKMSAAYLPLEDFNHLSPQILEDLDQMDLLVVDDLHLIAGNLEWEEKIFHCFNKVLEHNKKMVISSEIMPQKLELKLLDLKSRMMSGLGFALKSLTDEEKLIALQLRANLRGLDLPNIVAKFLLNHYQRDPKNLFLVLEKLDKASLLAQRKLTIPFVKEVLDKR